MEFISENDFKLLLLFNTFHNIISESLWKKENIGQKRIERQPDETPETIPRPQSITSYSINLDDIYNSALRPPIEPRTLFEETPSKRKKEGQEGGYIINPEQLKLLEYFDSFHDFSNNHRGGELFKTKEENRQFIRDTIFKDKSPEISKILNMIDSKNRSLENSEGLLLYEILFGDKFNEIFTKPTNIQFMKISQEPTETLNSFQINTTFNFPNKCILFDTPLYRFSNINTDIDDYIIDSNSIEENNKYNLSHSFKQSYLNLTNKQIVSPIQKLFDSSYLFNHGKCEENKEIDIDYNSLLSRPFNFSNDNFYRYKDNLDYKIIRSKMGGKYISIKQNINIYEGQTFNKETEQIEGPFIKNDKKKIIEDIDLYANFYNGISVRQCKQLLKREPNSKKLESIYENLKDYPDYNYIILSLKRLGDWGMALYCKNEGIPLITCDILCGLFCLLIGVPVIFKLPTIFHEKMSIHKIQDNYPYIIITNIYTTQYQVSDLLDKQKIKDKILKFNQSDNLTEENREIIKEIKKKLV